MTLDWQRLSDGTQLCQWLWGRPVSHEISNLTEPDLLRLAEEVSRTAQRLDLQQVDAQTVGLHLPNETAIFDSCPFRPGECTGKHVVASGSGIMAS